MVILGIESSCDETGVAVYHHTQGLIAHKLHSQVDAHKVYGGVVPELASRDHVRYISFLVAETLSQAKICVNDIDAVAYTQGPGLIGALLVGASFAKSFAYSLGIPAIPIHHLEAHLLAACMACPEIEYPYLALLVSGGHTELVQVNALGQYEILGQTLDDAVGEAFDKTAKLMGIPYPGGSKLAALADAYPPSIPSQLKPFPRPMLDRAGFDFSFSGLKTHALNAWVKSDKSEAIKSDIAKQFQQAIVDTLVAKCGRAVESTGLKTLIVAGGVGANYSLRKNIQKLMHKHSGDAYFPALEFCTDNGAMIAYAGYLYYSTFATNCVDTDLQILVKPRWPLTHE